MTLQKAISARILSLCKEQNITVNHLSMICGITQSTLSNIVNGNTQNSTVSTVKKICDGLNMSLSDFFLSDEFKDLEQEVQ